MLHLEVVDGYCTLTCRIIMQQILYLSRSFMNGPIHIIIQKEAPNNVKSRLTHIQVEHTRMILHKKP